MNPNFETQIKQRFSSDILWHFTGGGGKSEQEAFTRLISILKTGLKRGEQEEVFTCGASEETVRVPGRRACCLADIPLKDLHIHVERYNNIALGFHKESVIRRRFNPVLYVNENASLLTEMLTKMRRIGEYIGKHDPELFREHEECMRLVGSFCKTGTENGKGADTVSRLSRKYYEREWFSLEDWDFSPEDVAILLLPGPLIPHLAEERRKGGLRLLETTPVLPTDMIYRL